ncbi:MAG: imidazole glycerol phosphate synthase subunit HisH [Ignavibacteriales bacterium]|nr:imidazole glycerol phosphate synthase subunit HisH [Ignavibacteriales bacterium]
MIGIIDHGAGNIRSLKNALNKLGAQFIISNNVDELKDARKLILPGVGEARTAMESLDQNRITPWLKTVRVPFLGICLGMQLMYEQSDERKTPCLGILPGEVLRFTNSALKVPHMGWNQVRVRSPNALFSGLGNNEFFYFIHSYFAPVGSQTFGVTEYGRKFSAAVIKDNFYGVQFHPEKSGDVGLRLLKNFIDLW